MKNTLSLLLLVLVLCGQAASQQQTNINDQEAARMLLGRHMFSLQWVSWDRFGAATVVNRKGVYRLTGEQRNAGGDLVKIDGVITSIDEKEFGFNGTIVTLVSHINGGAECVREGEFTFRITGKRKYWRLMQMENPCDPVTDYVDIFFK